MAKKKTGWKVHKRLTGKRSVAYTLDIRRIVRDRLKQLDKSQYWLAQQVGMSKQGVWNYLNGRSDMNSGTLDKVLDALGLEVRPKE